MATTLDVVKGISQVMANSHDGARDEDGNPIKTGLKREEEYEITDRRIIDGFKVKIQGNKLILNYHSECLVGDVHDKKFENNVESTMEEVVKYLKKEYKKITGNTLSLKQTGEMEISVESTSRIRTWVRAQKIFEIKGLDKEKKEKGSLEKSIKDWIKLGKNDKSY